MAVGPLASRSRLARSAPSSSSAAEPPSRVHELGKASTLMPLVAGRHRRAPHLAGRRAPHLEELELQGFGEPNYPARELGAACPEAGSPRRLAAGLWRCPWLQSSSWQTRRYRGAYPPAAARPCRRRVRGAWAEGRARPARRPEGRPSARRERRTGRRACPSLLLQNRSRRPRRASPRVGRLEVVGPVGP